METVRLGVGVQAVLQVHLHLAVALVAVGRRAQKILLALRTLQHWTEMTLSWVKVVNS